MNVAKDFFVDADQMSVVIQISLNSLNHWFIFCCSSRYVFIINLDNFLDEIFVSVMNRNHVFSMIEYGEAVVVMNFTRIFSFSIEFNFSHFVFAIVCELICLRLLVSEVDPLNFFSQFAHLHV